MTAKKGVQKQKPGKKRILFPRKEIQPKSSEENIMLALNKALQKVGKSAIIWFNRIRYLQSGTISALLTKKAIQKVPKNMQKYIYLSSKDCKCGGNWVESVKTLATAQSA